MAWDREHAEHIEFYLKLPPEERDKSPLWSRPVMPADYDELYQAYQLLSPERFNGFAEAYVPVASIDVMARRLGLDFVDLLKVCRWLDDWQLRQKKAEEDAKKKDVQTSAPKGSP